MSFRQQQILNEISTSSRRKGKKIALLKVNKFFN